MIWQPKKAELDTMLVFMDQCIQIILSYYFRNSLYSSTTLIKYREILKDYSSHLKNGNYTHDELWKMKYACMGSLHPETQEPINILFRWSSFAPVNIPIIMALSVLPPTVSSIILNFLAI